MADGKRLAALALPNTRLMILSTRVVAGVLNYVWGEELKGY